MALNSNTWYSIQSFGTDFYLSANAPSQGSSGLSPATSAATDNALWQFRTNDTLPTGVIRPEAYGNNYNGVSYCLADTNLQPPELTPCSNSSWIWIWRPWNGNDVSEGYYISNDWPSANRRLRIDPFSNAITMNQYQSGNSSDDVFYQWAIQSVSAINDQSWSTVSYSLSTTSTTTTSSTGPSTTDSATTTTTSPPLIATIQTTDPVPPESRTTTNLVTVSASPSNDQVSSSRTSTVVVTATPSSVSTSISSPTSSQSSATPSVASNQAAASRRRLGVIEVLASGLLIATLL